MHETDRDLHGDVSQLESTVDDTGPEREGILTEGPDERTGRRGFVSRRSFLHGLVAAGATVAFFSTEMARAQSDLFRASDISDDTLLAMFDQMLDIRWFDRTLADRTARGEVRGYTGHFYVGQEAVAVGASYALRSDDYVLSTHRPHGHALAKGVDMKALAAEIFMKANGLNGGFAGTMHVADPSVGFLGADGIVGPGSSFGNGVAFASKIRGDGRVTLTYGGDGHWANPHFHSALNEAAVANLPFIYLVENNGYLQYAANDMIRPVNTYTSVARAMGIPAEEVNGQDVLAVYNTVEAAAERARNGGGPTFIEAKTYRYYVHSGAAGVEPGVMGSFGPDPLLINISQRPEREVRSWMAKDPVVIFRQTLLEFGVLDEAGADERVQAAQARVEEAFAFAEEGPTPDPESGLDNVFAGQRMPARHIL